MEKQIGEEKNCEKLKKNVDKKIGLKFTIAAP